MARIELSNIGGGGGTTLSLTTTGTSGAATLAGSVLNIPIYQGQLTLTTTGTSGAATLSGDILNIPQYSGGGGTPAGSAGQVQFNSTPAGSFAASANLAWDDTNVRLNIGAPSAPTGRLNVRGGGTTGATATQVWTNSGNTELMRIRDDGLFTVGTSFESNGSSIVLRPASGSSVNSFSIYANTTNPANLSSAIFYPNQSGNIGQSFTVVPRGTGFSATIKSQFAILGTDSQADPVNTEFLVVRATGTSYTIGSGRTGSASFNPIILSSGAASGEGLLNQLRINTNGTISLNKTPTNYQLDVTAASTFDGFRVVGSGNTSGRVAFQVQSSTATLYNIDNDGKVTYLATNTAAGTTGAQTINRPSGTVNFGIGAGSLVVTNSLCTTSSIVFATVRTNDATAYIKNVVPAAGSFTINLGAAATAETSVGFFIIN